VKGGERVSGLVFTLFDLSSTIYKQNSREIVISALPFVDIKITSGQYGFCSKLKKENCSDHNNAPICRKLITELLQNLSATLEGVDGRRIYHTTLLKGIISCVYNKRFS
jgi:hypothetical protein